MSFYSDPKHTESLEITFDRYWKYHDSDILSVVFDGNKVILMLTGNVFRVLDIG